MRIGWIGAGKVGCSLGRYFTECGIPVSGYYSRNPDSAREAADRTGSRAYETIAALAQDSEVIFITVPDNEIAHVWEQIKTLQIRQKIICHCSGVLSSEIFSDIAAYVCSGYSIHPLLAINSKSLSHQELSRAIFTIEKSQVKGVSGISAPGMCASLFSEEQSQETMSSLWQEDAPDAGEDVMVQLLKSCGNQVIILKAEEKVRYHAAAVMASNLVCGLLEASIEELTKCGFTREDALHVLAPLMRANVNHIAESGLEEALTGPIERSDTETVELHLKGLAGENQEIYTLLSKKVLAIAKRKHPDREYGQLEAALRKENI